MVTSHIPAWHKKNSPPRPPDVRMLSPAARNVTRLCRCNTRVHSASSALFPVSCHRLFMSPASLLLNPGGACGCQPISLRTSRAAQLYVTLNSMLVPAPTFCIPAASHSPSCEKCVPAAVSLHCLCKACDMVGHINMAERRIGGGVTAGKTCKTCKTSFIVYQRRLCNAEAVQ
jgi:hypothetical protein